MSEEEWLADYPEHRKVMHTREEIYADAVVPMLVTRCNAELLALREERDDLRERVFELQRSLDAAFLGNRHLAERLNNALMQLGGEP